MRCLLILPLLSAVAMTVARADERAQIPSDGSWARYYLTSDRDDGMNVTGTITIRFVGTMERNGQRCRWIELEEDYQQPQPRTTILWKLLIPERQLLESRDPTQHVIHGWIQDRDEKAPARRLTSRDRIDIAIGSYLVFLPGPLRRAKPLDEAQRVDYQDGQLHSDSGFAGRYDAEHRAATTGNVYTFRTDYSIWLHPDVPIGLAAAKIKVAVLKNGEPLRPLTTAEWSLEDFGTDAVSALPHSH